MALSYLQIDPVYGVAISGEPYRETLSSLKASGTIQWDSDPLPGLANDIKV